MLPLSRSYHDGRFVIYLSKKNKQISSEDETPRSIGVIRLDNIQH